MNYKPQTLTMFTRLTAAAAVAISLVAFFWIRPAALADESAAPAASADETKENPSREVSQEGVPAPAALLSNVRAKLDGLDSLSCDLHETVILSGMKFSAAGRYLQSSGNRFRLEFRIMPSTGATNSNAQPVTLDGEIPEDVSKDARGSLTQVSDGSIVYSYWQNGADRKVTRRNINDILKATADLAAYDSSRAIQDLGLGGLKTLFARIEKTMEFMPVRRELVADRPVLVINGRWNSEIREKLFQLPPDAEVIPQDFIPEYVRIYVDEETSLPRRIQYLKRSQDPSVKQVRPIVTMDLRQIVLNEALDEGLFQFEAPEGVVEEDITEQTLQEIRQSGQGAPPQQ
ncbi:MAG: hypothetical protein R3C20_11795 [Planctomycetaceae bacterium]